MILFTAACIAKEMGLPIRIVCAVTNDALHRAVYDKDYSVTELVVSIAPAINIQVVKYYYYCLLLYSQGVVFFVIN